MKSVQQELNSFFNKVIGGDYDILELTSSALTQARAKLKPGAFLELNDSVVRDFYADAPYDTWKGHRVLAIDGSTANLPSHKSIIEHFGMMQVGRNADVPRSMARISICYDTHNLLTLHAAMESYCTSERAMLNQHLEKVDFQQNDILLADRGYASKLLMFRMQDMCLDFCFRMKDNWWKEVYQMQISGETDKEVCFRLSKLDKKRLGESVDTSKDIRCRLVIIDLENGSRVVLCTSLLCKEQYTKDDLKELYHKRWEVEEAYKLLKCRANLEAFTGKTAIAVQQDFYSKIFMMTFCAAMSFSIEEKVRKENKRNKDKHPKQINRTNALGFFHSSWVGLWFRKKLKPLLKAFDKILTKTTDIVRDNRSFPRKHKVKHPPSMNYKPL